MNIQRAIKEYLDKHAERKRWLKIVFSLGLVVSLITTALMTMPATAKAGVLICEKEEHTHGDECYTKVLAEIECGNAEQETHLHDDSCYTDEQVLVCEKDHEHIDECYETVRTLTCDKDEFVLLHTHDENCYDSEGNLICSLEEHKEHEHTDECYEIDEEGNKALICEEREVKEHPSHTEECYETDEEGNKVLICELPLAIVHQHTEECIIPEHELFTCDKEEHIHTDECYDYAKAVADENETEKENAETAEPVVFEDTTTDVHVMVKADRDAFPEGTTMTVSPVASEDVLDTIADTMGSKKVVAVKAVDITFWNSGEEVEPSKPITVTMSSDPEERADESTVIHIDHEGTADVVAEQDNTEEITFDTDSFSVYVMTYTVDFEYEVDGNVYTFSMTGGDVVSFRDLVEILHIFDGQDADRILFVQDIEDIEFSNASLVLPVHVAEDTTAAELKEQLGIEAQYSPELTEDQIVRMNAKALHAGDWVLISLRPFLSEENISVTMKNGDVFTVKVTDGQIRKTVISSKGDTYEITVTYSDDAGIPEGAELSIREIHKGEKEYADNVDLTNQKLRAQEETEFTDPIQFDISIVSDDIEVEPKEGSIVNVELRLARSLFIETESEETDEDGDDSVSGTESTILFNGQEININDIESTECIVAHVTDDDSVDLVNGVKTSVEDSQVIVEFETESFSDYMVQGVSNINSLSFPNTIYVGDEIYMQNSADIWVTQIGSVVTETKHNNQDGYKVVRAIAPGTFRMCHRNDWNGGNPSDWNSKIVTVLPARTGTTPPRELTEADGIINNSSIGLKLNLFDYDLDAYLDDRFNNYDYGGNNPATSAFVNHGINENHALKFWGSGITNSAYGDLNNYVEHGVTQIVETNLNGGTGGYPKLRGYNETLEYLFSPANGNDKNYYGNVDGLFRKVDDYYIYDSNQNYAYYNGEKFVVYDGTYEQKSRNDGGEQATHTNGKPIGFFPFHPWDEDYDLYVNWNKNLNHHFGMSMSVDFALPEDPKAVKDTKGNDIIFNFSGDDDMWVFIDGKLAMDIGGIHQPTTGTINFTKQEVIVNSQRQTGYDFSGLYDGEKHTLQVFYIERGGCDSNCLIQFNITRYGDVEFKKVDDDDNTKLLEGAIFGLYRDSNCTTPLLEQLKDGTSPACIAKSDADGKVNFKGIPLGTYYMKEIWAPEGYPLDPTVHTVNVYLDPDGRVKARVSIDGVDCENPGVEITNKHPEPINLGLKKIWQNANGDPIPVPLDGSATFELKRIRTYETYTEELIPGQTKNVSKLTVGWVHDGQTHIYKEYSMISGTTTTVSWSYAAGYEGRTGCVENNVEIIKPSVSTNIYSEAITMPSAGEEATLYIIDDSDNGGAIANINVAGQEFIGNSGGGIIHHFETITEPDPTFQYTGAHVTNNQVTLPVNGSWEYNFTDLPLVGTAEIGGKSYVCNYSYYLEEISTTPVPVEVVYFINGEPVNSPTDTETTVSGTEEIVNRINYQFDLLKVDERTNNPLSGAEFTIQKVKPESETSEIEVIGTPEPSEPAVTGSDGKTSFRNIPLGYYVIKETVVPVGHIINGDRTFYIHVDQTGIKLKEKVIEDGKAKLIDAESVTVGNVTYSVENNTVLFTVENTPGAELPYTGGIGTYPYQILGGLLIMLGVTLLRVRRKKGGGEYIWH